MLLIFMASCSIFLMCSNSDVDLTVDELNKKGSLRVLMMFLHSLCYIISSLILLVSGAMFIFSELEPTSHVFSLMSSICFFNVLYYMLFQKMNTGINIIYDVIRLTSMGLPGLMCLNKLVNLDFIVF